ncbi:MAG TPA: penicillin-binding transpeptidase domain-containing protein [Pseudobacteroides sp.]|uniref:penicillin-binding transpeptidase domain-containing protein n=1 Tax=Pseudobacteroides sp. TaxID=1968840 RepID=UPI002F94BBB5
MSSLQKIKKGRIAFVLFIFVAMITALIGRFVWLQIIEGGKLSSAALAQQTRDTLISPRRGNIYDRNRKELAVSIPYYTISVCPENIHKLKEDADEIASMLSQILQTDKNEISKKLANKKSKYQLIKRKVDKDTSEKIKTWIKEKKIEGVYLEEEPKRYYPAGSLASHVIGFTDFENSGVLGIERTMDKYLKGKPGKILSEVDAGGQGVMPGESKVIDVRDGSNIVLTIDEVIQDIADRALSEAITQFKVVNGGTAIVMDPRTGEILAMVSKPDFDLNKPTGVPQGADPTKWKGTGENEGKFLWNYIWKNKTLADTYEPGSTFKTITSAIGIEEGLVTPDTTVNDFTYRLTPNSPKIDCHLPNRHGVESFRLSMYRSCNPVYAKLSQDVGLDRFYGYMKAFGFYDKTGIELPEELGGIFQEKPTKLDMAVASFGQRFTITPLQLITAYSAIANGGKLLEPHIVKEITDQDGNIIERNEPEVVRNVISRQTSETLKDILLGVVSDPNGTGGKSYVKGYGVAGKTGTAETTKNTNRLGLPDLAKNLNIPWAVPIDYKDEERYVASFAGLAPIDNPVITILVTLDYPNMKEHTGGYVAAPVAGKIIEETLEHLGVERKYTERDKKLIPREYTVPDVRNMDIENAAAELKKSKLDFIKEDLGDVKNTKVISQYPKPGTIVRENSFITLYMYKTDKPVMVKVPDLSKKTVLEAINTLNDIGLNIKVNGEGFAVSQSVLPGKEVQKGYEVGVNFETGSNLDD